MLGHTISSQRLPPFVHQGSGHHVTRRVAACEFSRIPPRARSGILQILSKSKKTVDLPLQNTIVLLAIGGNWISTCMLWMWYGDRNLESGRSCVVSLIPDRRHGSWRASRKDAKRCSSATGISVSHSQTTMTFQPSLVNDAVASASRCMFDANLLSQNTLRVLGIVVRLQSS